MFCKANAGISDNAAERRRAAKSMLRAGNGTLEVRLFNASMEGFLPAVRQLIDEGANVNGLTPTTAGDSTPLIGASLRGHLSCVRALLEAGADVNLADRDGYNALITASENGHIEIVKLLLLQNGINVNMKIPAKGQNSMFRAISNRHVEIVRALLAHPGIDVNARKKDSGFALLTVCYENYVEIVLMLLAHPSIDVNLSVTSEGKILTGLFSASRNGNADIVRALLAHPTIDMKCPGNAESLIEASGRGHHEIARLLLSHPDVDVNLDEQETGLTPLCAAIDHGHVEVVRVLLSASSIDVNKRDASGWSPLNFARHLNHRAIVTLLTQAGAR